MILFNFDFFFKYILIIYFVLCCFKGPNTGHGHEIPRHTSPQSSLKHDIIKNSWRGDAIVWNMMLERIPDDAVLWSCGWCKKGIAVLSRFLLLYISVCMYVWDCTEGILAELFLNAGFRGLGKPWVQAKGSDRFSQPLYFGSLASYLYPEVQPSNSSRRMPTKPPWTQRSTLFPSFKPSWILAT